MEKLESIFHQTMDNMPHAERVRMDPNKEFVFIHYDPDTGLTKAKSVPLPDEKFALMEIPDVRTFFAEKIPEGYVKLLVLSTDGKYGCASARLFTEEEAARLS